MGGRATILHADLDAFYASVEQLLDPALRGKPVAVGGGVVLAASYEAKRFGVQGGMAGWRARQLCPSLVFVGGHFREYQRFSAEVMAVLGDFTPHVQPVSIDEAFLDVAGSVHLFGPPEHIAATIRERVRDDVGLPISIGVARTKHLVKIASQAAKPDGLVVVPPDDELAFLHPLPVGLVWGIGPVARRRLAARGIRTIGDLAESSPDELRSLLGRALGDKVGALAVNDDDRRVAAGPRARSVGAQSALGRREATLDQLRPALAHLADRVAGRLRAKGRAGRRVSVRVRFADMRAVTRAVTLPHAIDSTLTLTQVAEGLVAAALRDHPDVTHVSLVAVSVALLVDHAPVQLELPLVADDGAPRPGSRTGATRLAVDRSVDAVRQRFGRDAVGYGSVVLSSPRGVPDDFRELAEHD
jgi:DNA polymerase-4